MYQKIDLILINQYKIPLLIAIAKMHTKEKTCSRHSRVKKEASFSDKLIDSIVEPHEQKMINGEKYINYEGLMKMLEASPLPTSEKIKLKAKFEREYGNRQGGETS